MRSTFLSILLMLLLSGCTWQDTLSEIGAAPEYLRLTPVHEVVNPLRWRLSAAAEVHVAAAGPAPQHWTDAAVDGVGRVFPRAGTAPVFTLEVHWPRQAAVEELAPAGASNGTRAGLFGFLEMPSLPSTGQLDVSLRDAHGRHLHQLALRIKPELWGKAWSEPAHIEAAFAHLANHLRGG